MYYFEALVLVHTFHLPTNTQTNVIPDRGKIQPGLFLRWYMLQG